MAKCQQSGRKSFQTKIYFFDKDKRTLSATDTGGFFGAPLYFTCMKRRVESHPLLLPPLPPPPKQKCWCVAVGVAFDYVAVQSKAVMLLSHLDRISLGRGNARSCVRRDAVTAWQPRFRQRDGGERGVGGELGVWSKCTTAFVVCFAPPLPPPPHPPRCSRVS